MLIRRVSPVLLLLAGLAVLPAHALPLDPEGLNPHAVELAQYLNRSRGNTGGDGFPSRGGGGGGRFPGRGGGFGFDPGVFLPPLIDAVRPRGRPPVYVEDDDDDVPVRPRRRPKPVQARAAPQRVQPPRPPVRQARPTPPRIPPVSIPVASERRYVPDEVLIELRDAGQLANVLRRHQLTELGTLRFVLPGVSVLHARVEGGRSARQVLQQIAGDARIAAAQPNYLYTLQQDAKPQDGAAQASAPQAPVQPEPAPPEAQKAAAIESPAAPPAPQPKPQYVLEKLGVEGAHRLAQGAKVKVALIDTGLDDAHPELKDVIAGRFDALGTDPAGTLEHGTAMAGAIVARQTLRGVSPGAELLAARAFGGPASAKAQGTSVQILQSLDWAAEQGARVVNLSFAGPQDRLLGRSLEGARSRKIIAIAAVGNAGPGTPPLYPAAEPSVLAVTATDAQDAVFNRANTGAQVGIAAPGVDVIAAAPEGRYAFSSGTSIAAAHVSGLVALMVERNPDLDLAGVKRILTATAMDLGAKGADPVYGAGRADAAAAVARASEEAVKK